MPSNFPSRSARNSMRSGRVQAETSRDRRTRHEPFSDEHAARNKHKKWKTLQQHLIAASGEFCGTFMFLWFAFAGTEAAILTGGGPTTANGVMLISLAFGFSLLVNVWAFYRISGGLFNPAVSFVSAFNLENRLTRAIGPLGNVHHREPPMDPSCLSIPSRAARFNLCLCSDPMHVPRCPTSQLRHDVRQRHFHHPRRLH
jgi:hypothetical protein